MRCDSRLNPSFPQPLGGDSILLATRRELRFPTASTQTGHRGPPFWIARKPEVYLFSTEACSIALSCELPPLPAQECMTTLDPR
jgi:hypothetical protein